MLASKDYTYVTGTIVRETEMAILFLSENSDEVWIPKSQIEEPEEFDIGEVTQLLIPSWLARDKGLA